MSIAEKTVRETLRKQRTKFSDLYNQRQQRPPIEVGKEVWLKDPLVPQEVLSKFSSSLQGLLHSGESATTHV
ncbi:unnamed protein product [Clavelina lepadiformis]|uniref:Uncharacterized protein n=1 Tax=Clavelina lepadiformis TaxID=159417 RepID=A0ABP0EW64_CLALP